MRFVAGEIENLINTLYSHFVKGFHVNADISDAWSGFSSAYLEEVRETYAKTPIMVFGHERDHLAPWKASRKYEDIEDDVKHPLSSVLRMNEMLALSRLEAVCDMVIPLSCPTTWRNDYNLKVSVDGMLSYLLSNRTQVGFALRVFIHPEPAHRCY